MSRSRRRGFTMVELVVVIVLLGIVAAFALPRFMGLESRARVATVNDAAGSIRSAANMAHGIWLANGNPATIKVDSDSINMTFGYPDTAGMALLIQDTSGFTLANTAAAETFTPNGSRKPAGCYVQYKPPTSSIAPYTLAYPGPAAAIQATLQSNC